MSKDSSHLGKGLSSIFGGDITQMLDDIQNGQNQPAAQVSEPLRLPLSQIRPNPYQPRKVFDQTALEELAASIAEHGVFTPVLVKKSISGYELIAGERRLRASRLANQETIPAIIVDFDDQQMMEISLLENIQRENLNVIEEAKAYDQLIKSLHYTQEQLAARVGKSREHIANLLRLLKLPDEVSQMVVDKKLSMGHVRALLPLKEKSKMTRLAHDAFEQGWSVRTMESKVRQVIEQKDAHERKNADLDPDGEETKEEKEKAHKESLFIQEAANQLEGYFQTSVKIRPHSIDIHFEDNNDLTRILELLSLTETEEE